MKVEIHVVRSPCGISLSHEVFCLPVFWVMINKKIYFFTVGSTPQIWAPTSSAGHIKYITCPVEAT
jgi:hypothetical protein